jgi:DNA-binding NtrC family response regulator
MKLGAFDYLLSPLDFSEVERTVIMMFREHQGQNERRGLEGRLADAQEMELHSSLPFPRRPSIDTNPIRGRLCDITAEFESKAIWQALKDNESNLSEAAKTLAISRTTLYAKMERYGIPKQ